MKKRRFPKTLAHLMICILLCGQIFPTFYVYADETTVINDEEKSSEDEPKDEEKSDTSDDDEEKNDDEEISDDTSENNEEDESVDEDSLDENAEEKNDDEKSDGEDANTNEESDADIENDTDELHADDPDEKIDIESSDHENVSDNETDLNTSEIMPDEQVEREHELDGTTHTEELVMTALESDAIAHVCPCPEEQNEAAGEGDDDIVLCPQTCPDVTIENESDAVVLDHVETIANTGNNEQDGQVDDGEMHEQEQMSEIVQSDTGDATSVTVVNNNINTNVITQNGDYLQIDIHGNYIGDIDLLETFQQIIADAKDQSNVINSTITNINNAVITNDVITEAITGANDVIGDAYMSTGSATAVTDVVNYVNTNIIGNNWLFAHVNIFGNWVGDLIVPGEGLLTTNAPRIFRDTVIVNENSAHVDNSVVTTANSGNNSILADLVDIQTGDAIAESHVVNVINTTIIKNNWFLLLVNNMGMWSGTLLNWGDDNIRDILAYDIGSYVPIDPSPSGTLSVYNNNNANVENNVVTTAVSGNNTVSSDTTTGNAWAITNIFNMINTNIIGDNWFFGVVNNMGSWQGNVEFAYPDLTISIDDGLEHMSADQVVDYTIHYKNTGQADCESTKIDLKLPDELSAEQTSWDLPGMKAGEEQSLTVHAKVVRADDLDHTLQIVADISTTTKEVALDNNHDSDQTVLMHLQSDVIDTHATDITYDMGEYMYGYGDFDSEIEIKRTSSAGALVKPGDNILNTIIVENEGDSTVYNVIVNDKMLDGNDTELAAYSWMIGSMEQGDRIMIQYELLVNNPGQKVDIKYVAKAKGENGFGKKVTSNKDSNLLTILGYANLVSIADAAELTSHIDDAQATDHEQLSWNFEGELQSTERLPLWIWLMTIIAFYLAIDWSLFPKKSNISM